MNLHALVRGAITTVNADIPAIYLSSTGNTPDAAGNQTPNFAPAVSVQVQVQPLSQAELAHMDFLGVQGILRSVYLFGLADGVARPIQKGGDLLTFDQGRGDETWLIVAVAEQWPSWARVTVALQQ